MNTKSWSSLPALSIALMAMMALTRMHHFGSAFALPDASLAIFFFAGIGVSSLWFFALLLFEAGFIDYIAITQFNVSNFCLSPAYVCLILTYATMWFMGKYCIAFNALSFNDSLKTFGLATLATTVAFIISNGSFYVLSDRFGELSWHQYVSQSGRYYPAYLSSTLIYIVIGLALIKLKKTMQIMTTVES